MASSPSKDALDLFRLLETPGVGISRLHEVVSYARKSGQPLIEAARTLRGHIAENLEALDAKAKSYEIAAKLERLLENDVTILSIFDPNYPSQLKAGDKAPPILFIRGNLQIANNSAVGFCGSRKASCKGIHAASDCASQLAAAGINVVSGYAAGVDTATHKAALHAEGYTTVVLPEGILNFRVKRELAPEWDWERVLVISQFRPGVTWNAGQAMQRNAVICGLSKALIVIEAGEKGGSIEAGRYALQHSLPVFTPVYEGMPLAARGNDLLIKGGASPLMKAKGTGVAKMDSVFAILNGTGVQKDSLFHSARSRFSL